MAIDIAPPGEIPVQPAEKAPVLKQKDIELIATAPTKEQLQQLAETRARNRNEDYAGTPESKDIRWARSLTKRYDRVYATHRHLSEEVARAKNAARWGDKDNFEQYQQLKIQRYRIGEELNFLGQSFTQAGLTLDKSQIPPSIADRLRAKGEEIRSGATETFQKGKTVVAEHVDALRARADTQKSKLGVWVGERVLSAKQQKDQRTASVTQGLGQAKEGVWGFFGKRGEQAANVVFSLNEQRRQASDKAMASIRSGLDQARTFVAQSEFAKMVQLEREKMRLQSHEQVEHLSKLIEDVQGKGAFAKEAASAYYHRSLEKAGDALGIPGQWWNDLRESGGMVVDRFNNEVAPAVREKYAELKASWQERTGAARGRLNRMFAVWADDAGPVLRAGKEALTYAGEHTKPVVETGSNLAHQAVEGIRSAKERVGRVYAGLSDYALQRATEAWAKVPGFPRMEIAKRTALLKARLASRGGAIGDLSLRAGIKLEHAVAKGVGGVMLAGEVVGNMLPSSDKGKAAVLGGLTGGAALALLARNHPEVLAYLQQGLGLGGAEASIGTASVGSTIGGEQGVAHVAAVVGPSGLESAISGQPPAETLTSVPPDTLTGVSGNPSPGAEAVVGGVAPPPSAEAVSNAFQLLGSTSIENGGSVYNAIKEVSASAVGDVVFENGIALSDMIADSIVQILRHDGANPDTAHAGNTLGEFLGRASAQGRLLAEQVANVKSPEEFRSIWANVQAYIRS